MRRSELSPRFARLGLKAGQTFDPDKLTAESQKPPSKRVLTWGTVSWEDSSKAMPDFR